jgi:hypothetical protein
VKTALDADLVFTMLSGPHLCGRPSGLVVQFDCRTVARASQTKSSAHSWLDLTRCEATATRESRFRLSRRTIRPSFLYSRYTRCGLAGDPRRLYTTCKRR